MKISAILGINARSQQFMYKYNRKKARNIADSKILSNRILIKADIPTPKIYCKFTNLQEVEDFDWKTLPSSFALKPSRGLGGEGIIVVKKKSEDGEGWITTQRKKITPDDLKLHAIDILEGAYSMGSAPDVAFVQEFVGRHKAFRKYSFRGTPDIRIIVFNKVPIMAMLRLPTRQSGGRANLHQGAIAVGVDITTGITTKAHWKGKYIKYKPIFTMERYGPFGILKRPLRQAKKRKIHGIKIPNWTQVLETAVKAQIVSGLGYAGVDIVLHPEKGPMVLELNARPGLQIQLANSSGLKKRLERIEDLEVKDAEHGVRIGKIVFAGRFSDRVKVEEGIKTISVWEEVKIVAKNRKLHRYYAKIDTGAWRTSIDEELARSLGLVEENNILWMRRVRTPYGTQERPIIRFVYYLAGKRVETMASLSKRSHLRAPVIIGRRDLPGFVIDPEKKDKNHGWMPEMWKKEK